MRSCVSSTRMLPHSIKQFVVALECLKTVLCLDIVAKSSLENHTTGFITMKSSNGLLVLDGQCVQSAFPLGRRHSLVFSPRIGQNGFSSSRRLIASKM